MTRPDPTNHQAADKAASSVKGADVSGLKAGEVCAGYGGLAKAVEEAFDAETVWFSEFEAGPSKILKHHWPTVPNHGDMTKIDWAAIEPVDIVSGGTPCQDLSGSGKRRGMTEGTRSNLWVQMREAIAIQKPTYVVWENVTGATSAKANSEVEPCPGCMGSAADCNLRALGRVLGDLSELGFNAEWRTVSAARHAGAVHGRARIFLLAYARGLRSGQGNLPARDGTPRNHRAALPSQPTKGHLRGINWGRHRAYIERWERLHGRAPSPFELVGVKPRPAPAFGEWLMGLPAGWITAVPRLSYQEQWKAIGNGVMPQQAAIALTDMLRSIHAEAL
jgi:DNA (cytosine-5)-methyltransferase 1